MGLKLWLCDGFSSAPLMRLQQQHVSTPSTLRQINCHRFFVLSLVWIMHRWLSGRPTGCLDPLSLYCCRKMWNVRSVGLQEETGGGGGWRPSMEEQLYNVEQCLIN